MHAPFETFDGAMREAIERQFEENHQIQLEEQQRLADQQRRAEEQRKAEEQRNRAELENQRFHYESTARQQQQLRSQQPAIRRRQIVYDLDDNEPSNQNPVSLLQIREQIQIGKIQ